MEEEMITSRSQSLPLIRTRRCLGAVIERAAEKEGFLGIMLSCPRNGVSPSPVLQIFTVLDAWFSFTGVQYIGGVHLCIPASTWMRLHKS